MKKTDKFYDNIKKQGKIPAIPPNDYKGSQSDWMTALQCRGLWDG